MVIRVSTLGTSKNTTPADLQARPAEDPDGLSRPRFAALHSNDPKLPLATKQRLRVLLVLEAAGGGTGRHVIDLAEGLIKRNHNVCLVYSPDRAEGSFRTAVENMHGIELLQLPMSRNPGLGDINSVRQLRQLIKENGPFDILHGHSSKAGALLRLAHRGLTGCCFYTPHAMVTLDPELGFAKSALYAAIERYLGKYSDQILCVSEEERTHAMLCGIPAQTLTVVHNGISLEGKEPRSLDRHWARNYLRLKDDLIVIGTVGRLGHQKAFDRLIRAFAMIAPGQAKLALVIIGDGPDRKAAEDLACNLGISRRVIFAGAEDGLALMPAFDIFALSSRYEGFPYVLLEAASCRLPIVMTEVGGASAMVEDGQTGFIVKQDDLSEMASRLATLAGNTELRKEMGARSALRAAPMTAEAMVDQILGVYIDAIKRKNATS
jgi:glycosyltransferase involved in cell wall biosynthesis